MVRIISTRDFESDGDRFYDTGVDGVAYEQCPPHPAFEPRPLLRELTQCVALPSKAVDLGKPKRKNRSL